MGLDPVTAMVIGGALAVLAAVGSNLGVNVQKRSHDLDEQTLEENRIPYYKRPLWWLGMSLISFGAIGDFVALGFAPQTVVASLGGGTTIVANVFIAHFWLKQYLFKTDIVGSILVVAGVVTCAVVSVPEESYNAKELLVLWGKIPFLAFLGMMTIFTLILGWRIKKIRIAEKKARIRLGLDTSVHDRESTSSANKPFELDHDAENGVTASSFEADLETGQSPKSQSATDYQQDGDATSHSTSSISSPKIKSRSQNSSRVSDDKDKDSSARSVDDSIGVAVADIEQARAEAGDAGLTSPMEEISYEDVRESQSTLNREDSGVYSPGEGILVHNDQVFVYNSHKVPLYYAAMAGIFGGMSILLAKQFTEALKTTFGGENQFVYPGTYIFFILLIVSIISQTHTLNLATMSGDTMSVFPVFQVFWIGMSNLTGIIFFQQYKHFNTLQWAIFPIALVIVAIGIYLLAKHQIKARETAANLADETESVASQPMPLATIGTTITEGFIQAEQKLMHTLSLDSGRERLDDHHYRHKDSCPRRKLSVSSDCSTPEEPARSKTVSDSYSSGLGVADAQRGQCTCGFRSVRNKNADRKPKLPTTPESPGSTGSPREPSPSTPSNRDNRVTSVAASTASSMPSPLFPLPAHHQRNQPSPLAPTSTRSSPPISPLFGYPAASAAPYTRQASTDTRHRRPSAN